MLYSSGQAQEILADVLANRLSKTKASQKLGVSRKTVYQWLKRYSEGGEPLSSSIKPLTRSIRQRKKLEGEICRLIACYPEFGPQKIARLLKRNRRRTSGRTVWQLLKDLELNTEKSRRTYARQFRLPKQLSPTAIPRHGSLRLTPESRKRMIKAVLISGRSVQEVAEEFRVSRKTLTKWKKRYLEASQKGQKALKVLADQHLQGEAHPRGTNREAKQKVLDLVTVQPHLSSHKIAEELGFISNHGVQRILERENLSYQEARGAYSRRHKLAYWTKKAWNEQRVFSLLKTTIIPLLIVVILGYSLSYFSTLISSSRFGFQNLGYSFAIVALAIGSFFFLYSFKYYITIALVLSFSHAGYEERPGLISGLSWKASARKGESFAKVFLSWLLGEGNGVVKKRRSLTGPVGLDPNLDRVKLKRYPFISVHLPMYNEKRVIDRLLRACTSLDYPNYEIIICDDSTSKKARALVNQWKKHPKVKVSYRKERSGFKGGALRETLKMTDKKAEFVVVLDADFVPYPDTLTLFIKYFKANNNNSEDYKKSNAAAVCGYQWHVLNKSQNWLTRGVRCEYAGSYVVERSGQEILGAMKLIHGSAYAVRRDALEEVGWGTSITEDFELTLRLYSRGYKVVFTPYIQAPAECVSVLKHLIRQRMRWAEGHSHNVRKYFFKLLRSPQLTLMEKLEWLYYSPYYLQAFLFLIGTLSWVISAVVFRARIPFWTNLWGWSLVLTNFLSLPLVNGVGLFLEESEEKDYLGLFSFVLLSYLLVPFQAYAALKGFLETDEGSWFRTPKTGKITDIFRRGTFYRWISGIWPRWKGSAIAASIKEGLPAPAYALLAQNQRSKSKEQKHKSKIKNAKYFSNPYVALATANNRFTGFKIRPKRLRWASKVVLAILLAFSVTIFSLSQGVKEAQASNWSNLYLHPDTVSGCGGSDYAMTTTIGSSTDSITFDAIGQVYYWFSPSLPTEGGDGNTGAGPWTFEFDGAWTGGTTNDSLTIDAAISLVAAADCSSPSSEDSASVVFNKNSVFPVNYSITLTNNASTSISSEIPKRVRLRLEVTGENKTGGVRLDYDGPDGADSNLQPSTLKVPEMVAYLVVAAPFIPMLVIWRKKRKGNYVKGI